MFAKQIPPKKKQETLLSPGGLLKPTLIASQILCAGLLAPTPVSASDCMGRDQIDAIIVCGPATSMLYFPSHNYLNKSWGFKIPCCTLPMPDCKNEIKSKLCQVLSTIVKQGNTEGDHLCASDPSPNSEPWSWKLYPWMEIVLSGQQNGTTNLTWLMKAGLEAAAHSLFHSTRAQLVDVQAE